MTNASSTGGPTQRRHPRSWIGTSGYDYPHWKGPFYPAGLPRSRWLAYVGQRFDSIEVNGTFYSLKSPATFRRWAAATPDGFVFSLKGSRFITHRLKLRNVEGALANFFASGVLALGRKTGPFLWQLPASHAFSAERLASFLRLLPRSSREAASLAAGHDARLRHGSLCAAGEDVAYRHALEARHSSWLEAEAATVLRAFGVALVVSDAGDRWPRLERSDAPFVYVRLHGSRELYASEYTDAEIEAWADRVDGWLRQRMDAYVYFDNDALAHAPRNALRMRQLLAAPALEGRRPTLA